MGTREAARLRDALSVELPPPGPRRVTVKTNNTATGGTTDASASHTHGVSASGRVRRPTLRAIGETDQSVASPPPPPVVRPASSSSATKRVATRTSRMKTMPRKLSEDELECQRAAYAAIQADDPQELQRILRPAIANKYQREEWLSQTRRRAQDTAFDFAALGDAAFGLEEMMATSLLHIAAAAKSIPCMRVLLRNGCDINMGDFKDNAPPLDELACNGYLAGIDFLLYEGADPTLKTLDRSTVLHTACCEQTRAVVEKFVSSGMDLEDVDKDGFSAIFWTLDNLDKRAGIDIAHYLVQSGAKVDVTDKKNSNLLMWGLSKVLEYYEKYCESRDQFHPAEEVAEAYRLSADRLDMLEYLLTLEGIDLSIVGHWTSKDGLKQQGDAFTLAHLFYQNDARARAELVREGQKQYAKDQQRAVKQAAAKAKKSAGKKKGGGRQEQADKQTDIDTTTSNDAHTPMSDLPDLSSSSPSSVAAPLPANPTSDAEQPADATSRKRAHSPSLDSHTKKRKHADNGEGDSQQMTDGHATTMIEEQKESIPPVPSSPSVATSVPSQQYILDLSHFSPPMPMTDCSVCRSLYPDETIPEACLRLVFMELLRRATNAGDWGDAKEVQRLLKLRESPDYPSLNRPLRYHQHDLLPRRAGPAHIACSYEDEGSFDLKILRLILSARIEDVTYNAEGYNALQLVCELGDVRAVDHFLQAGFDCNSTGRLSDAYTPLMLCCDHQSHGGDIAARLLAAGARLTTRDNFQNTAFQWAVYKGNSGVLEVLIRHTHKLALSARTPADPPSMHTASDVAPDREVNPFTWVNHWGNTIMHYACYKGFESEGHFSCLQLLLRERVAIDAPANFSGLVPRQVVAGFNAKHGRGKRVLVLLNSPGHKRVIDEPKGKEIAAMRAKLDRLEQAIMPLLMRSEPSSGKPATLSTQERAQLSKLRKEFRPLEDEFKSLVEKSRLALEAELSQLPHELTELHWTPKKKKSDDAKVTDAAAAAAAGDMTTMATKPPARVYPMPYTESDISRGREWTKIRLVNEVDTTGGLDYKYITHCLPHPFFTFPLPQSHGASYDATTDGRTGSGTATQLSAQQVADRSKRAAKQLKLDSDKAAKESGKKRKSATSKHGEPSAAVAVTTAPTPTPTSHVGSNDDAPRTSPAAEPNPRCDCVGPNACQDGSCPCFRKHTEKLLSDRPSSSVTGSVGAASSSSSSSAAAAVARMGKLCTRIEQLCNCHELCGCRLACPNRHISGGIRVSLVVTKTRTKGWACVADAFIPRGSFICEYVGEIVPPHVAADRLARYDQAGVHYVFGFQDSDMCIDPVVFGNVARTINHSCSPNLTKIQLYSSCMRDGKQHPKMAFFAAKDIAAGEELCISYDYEAQEHPGGCLVCYCNEEKCKHTLV